MKSLNLHIDIILSHLYYNSYLKKIAKVNYYVLQQIMEYFSSLIYYLKCKSHIIPGANI